VNFVTAHDGFTLYDLVSYNEKHNEANGENGRDGTPNNHSWNSGVEGLTDDSAINRLRERQIRNMLATLLLAQGLPMVLAGDEFHRTQKGNNNAYNQDNEISWVSWKLAEQNKPTVDFVRALTSLRHKYAVLRRSRFLTGVRDETTGAKDVTWIHPSGVEMTEEMWKDGQLRCFGMLLDGRAQPTGLHERGNEATLLLIFNGSAQTGKFVMPAGVEGTGWRWMLDTTETAQTDRTFRPGEAVEVPDRTVSLYSMY
jgi:glycogen operon protein